MDGAPRHGCREPREPAAARKEVKVRRAQKETLVGADGTEALFTSKNNLYLAAGCVLPEPKLGSKSGVRRLLSMLIRQFGELLLTLIYLFRAYNALIPFDT